MNIVLLTTETTHHTYYAWKLSERFPLRAIFVETCAAAPPFEVAHPFEAKRDRYEREVLLGASPNGLPELAPTRFFDSLNNEEAVESLRAITPEVILVFGTGKLAPRVLQVPTVACLNLHGGNPEHYRGLDTHLWAIYHNDFANLVTTLHYLDPGLDTGDIVFQTQLRLTPGLGLHQLRSLNTKACVQLSVLALTSLETTDELPSRKQTERGRYYSRMPAVLKEVCLRKFNRYIADLP
jgi:methionyl-tRNA formyltransferase